VEGEVGDLTRMVDGEDEVRRVAGRAAGIRQRALVDLDDVLPAELGEMVDEAVADDAGTDNDDAGLGGDGSHGRLLSDGFFALHCCLPTHSVRDAELCTMIAPPRGGRVKGARECSRQPSLAEISAAAAGTSSRGEPGVTSVTGNLR